MKKATQGGRGQSGFNVGDPIESTMTNAMVVIIVAVLFDFCGTFGFLSLVNVLVAEAMPIYWQILLLDLYWWQRRGSLVHPDH